MSYILNMKACWRAHNSCSSSSSSYSSVVICTSYWTIGASLAPVCQGWQPCSVISPVSLSRFSAGLEAPAGRWWGGCEEGRKREKDVMSSLCFLKSLSLSRGKRQNLWDRNRAFEASVKHIVAILRRITGSKNMQLTVVWGMLLHNSSSPC